MSLPIHLMVSYYIDPNPKRSAEIDACLKVNLQSGLFDTVSILTALPEKEIRSRINFTEKSEVRFISETVRTTYDGYFELAKQYGEAVHIIANSDIYFDSSIQAAASSIRPKECYAICRWDVTSSGGVVHYNHADSQDVWIFQTVPENIGATFTLGKAGCDNKIAYLLHAAGFKVFNPSKDVRTYHLHLSGIRNYSVAKDRQEIRPPFKTLPPCRLIDCK